MQERKANAPSAVPSTASPSPRTKNRPPRPRPKLRLKKKNHSQPLPPATSPSDALNAVRASPSQKRSAAKRGSAPNALRSSQSPKQPPRRQPPRRQPPRRQPPRRQPPKPSSQELRRVAKRPNLRPKQNPLHPPGRSRSTAHNATAWSKHPHRPLARKGNVPVAKRYLTSRKHQRKSHHQTPLRQPPVPPQV